MSWETILSDPGLQAIIALCFFFLIALAWGGIHNRRLAQRLLQTLQPLLPSLGKRTRIAWQGSAGFRVEVERAKAPFRKLVLFTRLLPRETMPALWAVLWLTGRRDALHITGTLRSTPRAQLRLGRHVGSEEGWHLLDVPGSYQAALQGGDAEEMLSTLQPLLESKTLPIERLNITPAAPHLQVEVRIAGSDGEDLAALLAGLTDLCRVAGRPPERRSSYRLCGEAV